MDSVYNDLIKLKKEEISVKKNHLLDTLLRLEYQKEEIEILSNEYVDLLQKTKTRLAVKEYRTTLYMIQKLNKEIKNVNLKIQTAENESAIL